MRVARLAGAWAGLALVLTNVSPVLATTSWTSVNLSDATTATEDVVVTVEGYVRITSPGVPAEGCTANCVVVVVWESLVRVHVDATDPSGFCWNYVWYTADYLDDTPLARDLFNEEAAQSQVALNPPAPADPADPPALVPSRCPGVPAVQPGVALGPLLDTAAKAITPPSPAVQPGTRALAGKRSFLVGTIDKEWSGGLSFSVPNDPVAGTTRALNGTASATMRHYYVDWEWDGVAVIDQAAADDPTRSVTGPHAPDGPRGYGSSTEVSWVWTELGTYTVAVQPTWSVSATVAGVGSAGPEDRRTPPSTTTIVVEQAQAVRQS